MQHEAPLSRMPELHKSAPVLRRPWIRAAVVLSTSLLALAVPSQAIAAPPSSVTVAGSLQSELGCSGDFQPDCVTTHLTVDATDGIWQGMFTVPPGSWDYKAALNNDWTENYGAHAVPNGANIGLTLSASRPVKFYYDPNSHWITDSLNAVIVTAAGSFQSELGCPGDWDPSCLRSWLEDVDGDGIYTFTTNALPAGAYETKAAINEAWDENYGAGGVPGGANISFTVPDSGTPVMFSYDSSTHVLTVAVKGAGTGTPSPSSSGAGGGPALPVTGSAVPSVAGMAGIAVLLVGVGLVVIARRRRSSNEAR